MVKSANKLPAIGVFGGTFDPVHFGHLRSALEVCQQLRLDHVRLLPCALPPHRKIPAASAETRRLLLELAVKQTPQLIVDDRELSRQGPSYSIDTLLSLRQEFADNPLFLIMGSDAFSHLDSWSRWQDLLSQAHIVIMERAGEPIQLSATLQNYYADHQAGPDDDLLSAGKIWTMPVTPLLISASHIRDLMSQDAAIDFLVPSAVITAMAQLGLYQNP